MIWLRYVMIQIVQLIAMVLGWVFLIPFCLLQAWKSSAQLSIKGDGRKIDEWKWSLLNYVYGNPEDGVSGQQAVVFVNGQPTHYYSLGTSVAWCAYRWSALRNSCDALKYRFAYAKGPLKTFTFGGWGLKLGSYKVTIPDLSFKVGWQPENGFNVPVFSVRKV